MSAVCLPLWRDVWFQAKRQKTRIVATVLMGNDDVRTVEFGPRGGWKFLD